MPYYLRCKKIDTAIRRAKKLLIGRAEKGGIYENFGVEEVGSIHDEFIDSSCYTKEENLKRDKLRKFDYWCSTYNG